MPPPTLVVLGAGHVGKALAGLGRYLGARVIVVDDRAEYANRSRFPEADEVITAPVADALARALAWAVAALPAGLGLLRVAWHRDKRGWHDHLAGTRVIRLS